MNELIIMFLSLQIAAIAILFLSTRDWSSRQFLAWQYFGAVVGGAILMCMECGIL